MLNKNVVKCFFILNSGTIKLGWDFALQLNLSVGI